MPRLSVIVPTHKRAEILKQCLHHLATQTVAGNIEVIVISDGNDPLSARLIAEMEHGTWAEGENALDVHYEEIEKGQQGIARNRGIALAAAPVTLFIGDDIFLEPSACEKHLSAHEMWKKFHGNPAAVLGFTTWDPSIGVTPVMRWLEESGWQFGYPKIAKFAHKPIPRNLQHRFTYTSNISLPTALAKQFPFLEDITLYGWEDIEWGMRLRDAGVSLFYEPDANALHHHRITEEKSLLRMETLGKSAVIMNLRDRIPTGLKRLAYGIAALFPTFAGRHRRAFLRGVRSVEHARN